MIFSALRYASLALCFHFSLSLSLVVRADDPDSPDNITGGLPPITVEQWVALGDSFAAGPGAGGAYDDDQKNCMRGKDAYPNAMQNDNRMPGPLGQRPPKPGFNFQACTGAVTNDLLKQNSQLDTIGPKTTFATLSIGGNDVGFAKILESCVYGRGKCDEKLDVAMTALFGPCTDGHEDEPQCFHKRYMDVLTTIIEKKFYWNPHFSSTTYLWQTGYSQFFDAETTQCNDAKFWLTSPKMTQQRRRMLNQLTHRVNYVIQYWLDLRNSEWTVYHDLIPGDRLKHFTAVDFADPDWKYNNHRFCRQGVKEVDRNNKDTWFYHLPLIPLLHNQNPNQTLDDFFTQVASVETVRTFHPKPAGHAATRDLIFWKLTYPEQIAKLAEKYLYIMCVGDVISLGRHSPPHGNKDRYGYLPYLKAIFGTKRYFGGENPNGMFLGREGRIYDGDVPHEIYPDDDIQTIHWKMNTSPYLSVQNKVIPIILGTKDLWFNQDEIEVIGNRLRDLLNMVHTADPNGVILLAQIPMIGWKDDGTNFSGLQRRVIEYNAYIAGLVIELATAGWRIHKVHLTTTTREHREDDEPSNDHFIPNGFGYRRMAYDWLEAFSIVNDRGWLPDRPNFPPPGPENSAPMAGRIDDAGKVICSQTRPSDAPSLDDITKSLFRGQSQIDFVTKVACNEEVICAFSWDSNILDNSTMNNGSTCVYAGGTANDQSNYHQLVVKRPPGARLSLTVCPFAITKIIDDCIDKGNSYGGTWFKDDFSFNITNLRFPDSPLQDTPSWKGYNAGLQSSILANSYPTPMPTVPPNE